MAEAPIRSSLGVARSISALRARVDAWRSDNQKVALVPTMGALHAGHVSLIRHAQRYADRVVVSIFVNPSQFAPNEDFDDYPRREDDDLAALGAAGCDLAYAPTRETMYPAGFQTRITVPDLAAGLCGEARPHFFGGVATVVCKLLNQARPHVAVFGEKDFQQLLVIRRMVADLNMAVDIIGAPIVREPDGLALSSRNVYLSIEERAAAPALNRAISDASTTIANGGAIEEALAAARDAVLKAGFEKIDYIEARRADTLAPYTNEDSGSAGRILAAAFLGRTRLIDNVPVGSSDD